MKAKFINFINLLVMFIYIIQIFFMYYKFPDKIALHYGSKGIPDNWGEKYVILIIQISMLLVPLILYLLTKFFDKIPKSMINLGAYKEYWLSDNKINETKRYLGDMFKIFNILFISFLIITFHLFYLANINNTNLNMNLFMSLTVIFLFAAAVWSIILIMKFYSKPK